MPKNTNYEPTLKTMSIKEYAIANKLSIYNVVKMTKNETVQTETKKVDGKDEIFIIESENSASKTITSDTAEEKVGDYEKAYFKLKIKYDQLKIKYDTLQKKIGGQTCFRDISIQAYLVNTILHTL